MNLEKLVGCKLAAVLAAKYNLGLVGITFVWWFLAGLNGYFNTGFDMLSTIVNYMVLTSVATLVAGIVSKSNRGLIGVSILTQVVAITILILSKSVLTNMVGVCLQPLAFFTYLLLLKQVWLLNVKAC